MKKRWQVFGIGALFAITLGLAAGYVHLQKMSLPVPDESDKSWVLKDEEKQYAKDRLGKNFLIWHKRFFESLDGKYTLGTHEIFGQVVMKAWTIRESEAGKRPHHWVAILDDDGKWRATSAESPEIVNVYGDGELRAIRIILRDNQGQLVAKRLIGRQSF